MELYVDAVERAPEREFVVATRGRVQGRGLVEQSFSRRGVGAGGFAESRLVGAHGGQPPCGADLRKLLARVRRPPRVRIEARVARLAGATLMAERTV